MLAATEDLVILSIHVNTSEYGGIWRLAPWLDDLEL